MRIRWMILAALMVAGLKALRSPQMQAPTAKVFTVA